MSGRLVLLRHGQSYGNVDHRLDTRPPGSQLTPLGHRQAREFAAEPRRRPGLIAHSVATRAIQTAAEISARLGLTAQVIEGIHEVQVGALENRSDDAAIAEFSATYQRWYRGETAIALPGGESAEQVLGRYLPVVADLRMNYLDDDQWTDDIVVVSHGAAIRLVASTLAGVGGAFALAHPLANATAVVLVPVTDGRWSCLQWGSEKPPFQADMDTTATDCVADRESPQRDKLPQIEVGGHAAE